MSEDDSQSLWDMPYAWEDSLALSSYLKMKKSAAPTQTSPLQASQSRYTASHAHSMISPIKADLSHADLDDWSPAGSPGPGHHHHAETETDIIALKLLLKTAIQAKERTAHELITHTHEQQALSKASRATTRRIIIILLLHHLAHQLQRRLSRRFHIWHRAMVIAKGSQMLRQRQRLTALGQRLLHCALRMLCRRFMRWKSVILHAQVVRDVKLKGVMSMRGKRFLRHVFHLLLRHCKHGRYLHKLHGIYRHSRLRAALCKWKRQLDCQSLRSHALNQQLHQQRHRVLGLRSAWHIWARITSSQHRQLAVRTLISYRISGVLSRTTSSLMRSALAQWKKCTIGAARDLQKLCRALAPLRKCMLRCGYSRWLQQTRGKMRAQEVLRKVLAR